jgi:hypothetical protein
MLWVPRITASSQGRDAQFAIRNFGGSPGFPDRFALIMRQDAIQTALAVGVGLLLSLAAGRVLSQILYQVSPSDPFALITEISRDPWTNFHSANSSEGAKQFTRPVLGHAKFTSNSRKEHDHRARLGTVSMAGNRFCRLPLDDVLRGVEGCVNPAPPLIFA